MIFLKIVLIILIVICIALIANIYEERREKGRTLMSFKESMDLAELPVVTFYQGGKKFNFLLDTGSNLSLISKEAAERLDGEFLKGKTIVSGIGTGETSGVYRAILSYRDHYYDIDLNIASHLTATFAEIKAETGVQIHGLIGSQFFQKYKYILDFKELIAYSK